MKRVKEKIVEIEKFLDELAEIVPSKFEDYKSNKVVKAACERYIEKIVEGITDVAFLIIKYKKFKIPEDDIDAFEILKDNNIISLELTKKLKHAKGMRNIIVHEYGKIDEKIIFEAINKELPMHIQKFLREISRDF